MNEMTTEPPLQIVLGNTPNIRIITFFIENPFDGYNIREVVKFTETDEKTTYFWLTHYMNLKILDFDTKKRQYAVKRTNLLYSRLNKLVGDVGFDLSKLGLI
jgi:hypothetical protein